MHPHTAAEVTQGQSRSGPVCPGEENLPQPAG